MTRLVQRLPWWALTAFILVVLLVGQPATAGLVASCTKPGVFGGAAVNVVILPYTYTGDRGAPLSEAAQRIALLFKLDLLATARYGSLGVIRLDEEGMPGACDADRIIGDLRSGFFDPSFGLPQPGSGVIVLWGRFFESADALYVQSYLSFFRHAATDGVPIQLANRQTVEAQLPAKQVAFAPRKVEHEWIDGLVRRFAEVSAVRSAPDENAPRVALELGGSERFAFGVRDAAPGWLELVSYGDQPGGFVRLGAETHSFLREYLPEFGFVDGLIGYLTLRARFEDHGFRFATPRRMVPLIEDSFLRYRSEIDPRREPLSTGLSHALAAAANLLGQTPGQIADDRARNAAREHLDRGAALLPGNANALTMAALVAMADPRATADAPKVEARLTRALMVAPGNDLAVRGLNHLYEGLMRQPDTALPYERSELSSRIEALGVMRERQKR